MFGATLDDLSWAEIKELAEANVATTVFSVGDEKRETVRSTSMYFQIGGFNVTTKSNGQKAKITFVSENLIGELVKFNNERYPSERGYDASNVKHYVDDTYEMLSADLKTSISETERGYMLFIPDSKEIGVGSYSGKADFPIFTTSDTRKKRYRGAEGNGYWHWWIRDNAAGGSNGFWSSINDDGDLHSEGNTNSEGVCLCFCIG